MITIYAIKPYFQKILAPLLGFLVRFKITPNQVTCFASFSSIGFGLYFAWAGVTSWYLMPFVFLGRMALNAIDGMLARQFQQQSHLGTYLNELGDMVSDLCLYLPFAILFPWLTILLCFLTLFSEVAGILATAIGAKRRYDGPMGKSDRAFYLSIFGFLLAFGWITTFWALLFLSMISLLLCITIFFRIKRALV